MVNDGEMRAFASQCLSSLTLNAGDTCNADSCGMDVEPEEKHWQGSNENHQEVAELLTVNPALGEGLRGVRILQQIVPFRTSRVKVSRNTPSYFHHAKVVVMISNRKSTTFTMVGLEEGYCLTIQV